MDRRRFLEGSGALASLGLLGGCAKHAAAPAPPTAGALPLYDNLPPPVPIRADLDRIFRITVCLRPFRAAGPRIEPERVADKLVVHHYGHGGSGWSLSWGSAELALERLRQAQPGVREIAVVGCGAIGLTTAVTAQRQGLAVTIYAKERPPFVRSSRATGSWTPDSRIALEDAMAPEFPALWERMARTSMRMYHSYLGAAGDPVEYTDRYLLEDDAKPGDAPEYQEQHRFAHLRGSIRDIDPRMVELPAGVTPFPTKHVSRGSSLTFNVASYSRVLTEEFLTAGGRLETREFHAPAELTALPQSAVINCTGYGARALWGDESIVPVRGQIAWLIPQEGVHYGIYYRGLNVLARRDGIVIQPVGDKGDDTGWNDTNERPDRAEAEAGVRTLQQLYARMQTNQVNKGK